jgi:uncharacterized membrane protein
VAGEQLKPPTKAEKKRIATAIEQAEGFTGLQLCIYIGKADEDTRAHAESLFVEQGLHARPAVLVLVEPTQRKVEVVTAPEIRARIPDGAAASAISAMTEWFARGRLLEGLHAGIDVLVETAGPGEAPPGAEELPDLLG